MQNQSSSKSDKVYRVVQWAAGRIGQSSMRAVIAHPALELVGLHVHSAKKDGRDAGELCGLDPIGIAATRNIDEVIALKPDCVLYMQEGYDPDAIGQLLEAGINVITTRSEFFYAEKMDVQLRRHLETACHQGQSSIFATGSSPGFSTAVMPLALTYLSRRLDCLTIDEFADIPASTSPEMITEVMGFGKPAPEEFSRQSLEHMSVGFSQSLSAVADALHVQIDGFETSGEFAVANNPVELPGGILIDTGAVAAQRITVAAVRGGTPVLQFRANWYCSKDIDQSWHLEDNGWRFLLEGDTPLDVTVTFPRTSESYADQMSGLTAHPAVNAIPYVCDAPPGIRSNADMPQIIPRLG